MGEGQLDSFTDFLLLHVETTDIGVRDVRFLIGAEHSNRGVGLRGQDIDESIGVAVESD